VVAVDAIVPVKELRAGKSRLGGLLSGEQRGRLVQAMLSDVLDALRRSHACSRIWVVTRDEELLRVAGEFEASPLMEPASVLGLNAALEWARTAVSSRSPSPEALLVLPADLPGITQMDVLAFLDGIASGPGVRLCPAHDGGTNALLLQPPGVIAFAFGPASAAAHAHLAAGAGIRAEVREVPGFLLDLDGPADLRRIAQMPGDSRTRAYVASLESIG
jgi:2-phospho-L-lactate guanylyltransferase